MSSIYKCLRKKVGEIVYSFFPKWQHDRLFKSTFGYKINWSNPKDLNEWIHWLSVYSDTRKWPVLADKYAVREYVKSCGFEEMLVPLLGVWKNVDEIDFSTLPESFVMKCNNGSGDAKIVTNNTEQNRQQMEFVRREMRAALKRKFGKETAEPHYLKIPPRIIAEEMLDKTKQVISSTSLIDYKFWYVYGVLQACVTYYDRGNGVVFLELFDAEWQKMDGLIEGEHFRIGKKNVPKPQSFERMKEAGSVLSMEFPLVRVDFYEVGGRPYFGEMTFTGSGGKIIDFTPEFLRKMGKIVKLNKLKHK